jgi:hypothetical protein
LNLIELDAKICYEWSLALVLINIEFGGLIGKVEAKFNPCISKMSRVFGCLVGQSI